MVKDLICYPEDDKLRVFFSFFPGKCRNFIWPPSSVVTHFVAEHSLANYYSAMSGVLVIDHCERKKNNF
jgi:hypothetical protein